MLFIEEIFVCRYSPVRVDGTLPEIGADRLSHLSKRPISGCPSPLLLQWARPPKQNAVFLVFLQSNFIYFQLNGTRSRNNRPFSTRLIARDEQVEVDARKEQTCRNYGNRLLDIIGTDL